MPETYVLDSSVVVSWFIPDQENHKPALDMLRLVMGGDVVALAPRYMRYEFSNAVTKAYRLRGKEFSELSAVFSEFAALPIAYIEESQDLMVRAAFLAHRFKKAFCDMGYFAVAEDRSVPVCTADKGCVRDLGPDFPARFVLLRELTG
jgi:predicted nucleic acid-binding protein